MMALVSESSGRLVVDEDFVVRLLLGCGGGGAAVAVVLETAVVAISFVGDGGSEAAGCLGLGRSGGEERRSGDGTDDADTNVSSEDADTDLSLCLTSTGLFLPPICAFDICGLTVRP